MNWTISCVGKLREPYWREACKELTKRLSRYSKLTITEVAEAPSSMDTAKALKEEGERLLRGIREDDYVIVLAVTAQKTDSVSWAHHLKDLEVRYRRTVLVIGGSMGLSEEVYARADERLSFSDFTFPYQLIRVVLLEQLYRASKILAGEPYHK